MHTLPNVAHRSGADIENESHFCLYLESKRQRCEGATLGHTFLNYFILSYLFVHFIFALVFYRLWKRRYRLFLYLLPCLVKCGIQFSSNRP